jgi:hypothetical protein
MNTEINHLATFMMYCMLLIYADFVLAKQKKTKCNNQLICKKQGNLLKSQCL